MSVRVLHPGLLLTLQDLGRPGHAAEGVPVSGAADALSLVVANRLLGNADGAPALEATLLGARLAFDADATLCLAGAPARARLLLDGVEVDVPRLAPFAAPRGSTLTLGPASVGVRTYVAAAGGFAAERILGSAATHVAAGLGGLDGRALRAGDELPVERRAGPGRPRALAAPARAWLDARLGRRTLRLLPGPDLEEFPGDARAQLARTRFEVLDRSDRTGVRLRAPDLAPPAGGARVSRPMPRGALEVPGPGEALLLLPDGPTTGGYAVLAVVAQVDHPRLGQLRPRERLRAAWTSLAEARTLRAEAEARLARWLPPA